MASWLVVSVVGLAALTVVVAAVLTARRGGSAPQRPSWTVPTPDQIRSTGFPLAWPGYDAAHVDALLDAVAAAYEELYAAAGPEAIARARAGVVDRRGRDAPRPR